MHLYAKYAGIKFICKICKNMHPPLCWWTRSPRLPWQRRMLPVLQMRRQRLPWPRCKPSHSNVVTCIKLCNTCIYWNPVSIISKVGSANFCIFCIQISWLHMFHTIAYFVHIFVHILHIWYMQYAQYIQHLYTILIILFTQRNCTIVLHNIVAHHIAHICVQYVWILLFCILYNIIIWLNLLHLLDILGHCSNYCTLLHIMARNKVDQYCWCLLFTHLQLPGALCLRLLHSSQGYCPCCSSLISHSN